MAIYKVLIRTQAGDEYTNVALIANHPRQAHLEVIARLHKILTPTMLPVVLKLGTNLFRVKSSDLDTSLLGYETSNMHRAHKVGVVYCAKGAHTELDMLRTSHAGSSPEFQQFISFLGQEVVLNGFAEYAGGLDVKNNSTGTHSVYTNFWGIQIMFHVSTLLPDDPNNPLIAISLLFSPFCELALDELLTPRKRIFFVRLPAAVVRIL